MRLRTLTFLIALALALPVAAQSPQSTGTLTAVAACPTPGSIRLGVGGLGAVSVQLAGTFAGTVGFFQSDDGVTFVALPMTPSAGGADVSTVTSTGIWTKPLRGVGIVCVQMTAYTSGTAQVTVQAGASGSGVGGGTIDGAITSQQVAFGTGTDTIGGSANLTWDGSALAVNSVPVISGAITSGRVAVASGTNRIGGSSSVTWDNEGTFTVAGDDGFGVTIYGRTRTNAETSSVGMQLGVHTQESHSGVMSIIVDGLSTPPGTAFTFPAGEVTLSGAAYYSFDNNLVLANGKALRTDTTTAHTALLQAYDTDTGPAYVTCGTLTNGTAPSFTLSAAAGCAINLGTPTTATLTNATGLPVATGVSGLGTGVATALAANTGASGGFAVNGVAGVANGYKTARGETALDGSNPTPVTTGLTTITGCSLTLKSTAAPGVGTSVLSYDTSSGTLNMYGWKVTSSGDTTLIASTGTETIGWVCIGT